MGQLDESIVDLIRAGGPLTGAELRERTHAESLALWQACRSSAALDTRTVGRRYLRLDRQVEGYARLSPSILREFLTYSVIGLAADPEPLEKRTREIASRIEQISKTKHDLARSFAEGIRNQLEGAWPKDRVCIVLAGDIVYGMAHEVPRPERSTGRMVRGSDIDIVVVLSDDVPDDVVKKLDDAIYQNKYRTLIAPSVREEIDYIVKKMARVHEQLLFDNFKRMVACKIMHEGVLLYGSQSIFDGIKSLLAEHGVAEKLDDLERGAQAARTAAEQYVLHGNPEKIGRDERILLYSAEESEEFE